ncbi:succinate transmembrane transporter [Aureococcus anophagefferens]|nr:succinate transmembrane transporter [Aureococcus anophagefferens]
MTLDGVDVDQFGDDEAAAFEASVADALGLPADDVGVVGVAARRAAAAAARRRRFGVAVDFTIDTRAGLDATAAALDAAVDSGVLDASLRAASPAFAAVAARPATVTLADTATMVEADAHVVAFTKLIDEPGEQTVGADSDSEIALKEVNTPINEREAAP